MDFSRGLVPYGKAVDRRQHGGPRLILLPSSYHPVTILLL